MTHLDLFSGIGGFALACEWAGIETIGFCEMDPFCQKVLKKHWPNVRIIGDIKDVKEDTFQRPIDIITGGFPCQPFSVAGKQRGKEDDRFLWPTMCNVIKEYKPTWVIGENVAGIINMALEQVLSDLENIGYETQSLVIPACAIGGGHRRDRVWVVAYNSCQRFKWETTTKQENDAARNGLSVDIYAENHWRMEWPKIASQICRMDDGLPRKLDSHRLKALGNAIVPQVAFQIISAIKVMELV